MTLGSWPPAFGALTRSCEGRLVDALALERLPLAPDLARMEGEWQGAQIVAEARAYRGDGVAFARFATVEGDGLSIGNLLVLPAPTSSAPIFGGDLVWIGTRPQLGMIACDLSPTVDDCGARAAQDAIVRGAVPSVAGVPPGGALPAWCDAIFSSSPLYTRFGEEDAGGATRAFEGYLEAFVQVTERSRGEASASVAPAAVGRGIDFYCLRHREDDRGLLLLERLFGKGRARRYLDEALFPISTDGCVT